MYHLHARYLAKTTGASAELFFQYIARVGRYKNRADQVREVIGLNMPDFVGDGHGASYWRLADSLSNRANARTSHLLEFAIPIALSVESQRELVVRFANGISELSAAGQVSHGVIPITFAIHEGFGKNPHVHLMASTSIVDGVQRSSETFFRRHNPQKPDLGGARRSRFMAKKEWLVNVRDLWAKTANQALAAHGLPGMLDHRSNAARGIAAEAGIHLGPSAAHLLKQSKPAPRVQKHLAVKSRNDELFELHRRIKSRRERLAELDLQVQQDVDVRKAWQNKNRNFWNQLLRNHPLGGLGNSFNAAATGMALETEKSNVDVIRMATLSAATTRLLVDAAGEEWDAVRTGQGLWLLRPNFDQSILIGPGYAVTDCVDAEGLRVFVVAARSLPYINPVVAVNEALYEGVQSQLIEAGLKWPIRKKTAKSIFAEPRSR